MNKLFKLQNQAERNTTNIQIALDYLSATSIMLVVFWIERISTLFLIAKIHSITNLKIHEQAKNLFNPAYTPSSSK